MPREQRSETPCLVIIDCQNFFKPMVEDALPNIERLYKFFVSKGWPIIFTQHGHTEDELTVPSTNQLVKKWGIDGSLHRGKPGNWELIPSIKALQQESKAPIVDKTIYDAFIRTDLEKQLRDLDVDRIVVVGVMTDCCCDTTARSAFNRGWETWLVRDACGSANDRQHQAGLKGFSFAFGDIPTTKEVIDGLK